MGTVTASSTTIVKATPEQVVDFLSDLSARPQILTGNYTAVTVEPDDVFAYHFTAGSRERDYRLKSSRSGTAITERDELSSFVNTWDVAPAGDDAAVRLTATWDGAGGIGGIFEGLFAPLALKRIYSEVLGNLAAVLTSSS